MGWLPMQDMQRQERTAYYLHAAHGDHILQSLGHLLDPPKSPDTRGRDLAGIGAMSSNRTRWSGMRQNREPATKRITSSLVVSTQLVSGPSFLYFSHGAYSTWNPRETVSGVVACSQRTTTLTGRLDATLHPTSSHQTRFGWAVMRSKPRWLMKRMHPCHA